MLNLIDKIINYGCDHSLRLWEYNFLVKKYVQCAVAEYIKIYGIIITIGGLKML